MTDDTTLIHWANLIQPKTLEKFNQRIMQLAVARKVTRGCKLRTDGTMVESNIHTPSDNRLLADGVRVLARTVVRAQKLVKQVVQETFEDFTQTAKQLARQIGETLRKKTDAAKSAGRQQYQELLEITRQTVEWARHTQKQLHKHQEQKTKCLVKILKTHLPRTQQVIDQTTRRILQGEQVPASEKIVSLFEEHTGVAPVAHASSPLTLIDRALFRFDLIWAAAGHPNGVVRLTPDQMVALTGAPVHDVVQD